MSQNTRAIALTTAVSALGPGSDSDAVLAAAEAFHQFVTKDDSPAAAPAAPAAPAAAKNPPKAPKPPKAAPKLVPEQEETDGEEEAAGEEESEGPSKTDVENVIAKLISKKLRDECVALLKKFKATSLSGIKEADYAKFLAEAQGILQVAELSS